MKQVPFKHSALVSIGVELELQIIDPMTHDLISHAKDLIRNIKESAYQKRVIPEITQSMIEINSSVHHSPKKMYQELRAIQSFLLEQSKQIGICLSGGGTHPFQKWTLTKIFPTKRFKNKARKYRYLSKRSTVFGQHIHIGCQSGDDAIYLTHALARYVPQLIAISASSPFYQGIDSGFHSSRSTVFNSFPLSGVMPYFQNWQEFSDYFYKMRRLGVVETMKDFYWDIRPKPEFGTVEIRVCDTPLTLKKAAIIAAYLQSIAHYLLEKKPIILNKDLYFLYSYNRFQASRYGLLGEFINPENLKTSTILDDILVTIKKIKPHIKYLKNDSYIDQLTHDVRLKQNDAMLLRKIQKQVGTLPKLVHEACVMWGKK